MAEWYNNSLKQHLTLPPFFISLMYLFLLLLPRQLMTWQKKSKNKKKLLNTFLISLLILTRVCTI